MLCAVLRRAGIAVLRRATIDQPGNTAGQQHFSSNVRGTTWPWHPPNARNATNSNGRFGVFSRNSRQRSSSSRDPRGSGRSRWQSDMNSTANLPNPVSDLAPWLGVTFGSHVFERFVGPSCAPPHSARAFTRARPGRPTGDVASLTTVCRLLSSAQSIALSQLRSSALHRTHSFWCTLDVMASVYWLLSCTSGLVTKRCRFMYEAAVTCHVRLPTWLLVSAINSKSSNELAQISASK